MAEGPKPRHPRSRSGAPAAPRPPARPLGTDPRRVAAPPPQDHHRGPGPLHGSHARAVTAAAPGALQVADRWHLLLDMRPGPWSAGWPARMAACGACPCSMTTAGPAGACVPSGGPTRSSRPAPRAAPEGRAAYEDVRRRHLAGETLMAIGRATGLAHATVRKRAHGLELPRARGVRAGTQPPRSLRRPPRAPHGRGLRGRHGAVRTRCASRAMAARPVRCSASRPGGATRAGAPHGARAARPRRRPGGGGRSARAALLQGARPRMLAQPVAGLPGHAAAAVARALQDAEAARTACLGRRSTALVRRGSRRVGRAASRPLRRARRLDRGGPDVRHRGDRDLRHRARARRHSWARRADDAETPRSGRGPDQPSQAHQAPILRPRRLCALAPPRPPHPLIHTKRRRATHPGQDHCACKRW